MTFSVQWAEDRSFRLVGQFEDMANNKCKAPKGDYFSPNTIYWNPAGSNRRLGENVSFVDESVIEQPFHI